MSTIRSAPVQAGFSRIAEALADPAREAMLAALVDGQALPAGELAAVAGISAQSASAHLQKLLDAGILSVWAQGRFRYYRIADDEVAALLESLANLATRSASSARRRRPVAPELCAARSCYHHLAGRLGVALGRTLAQRGFVRIHESSGELTKRGQDWCRSEGIAFAPARKTSLSKTSQNKTSQSKTSLNKTSLNKASAIRLCLDWTERLPHLGGPFPTAVFEHLMARRYLVRRDTHRALRLTEPGRAFFSKLGVDLSAD